MPPDRIGIIAGLVLFAGLITVPFWYGLVSGVPREAPPLVLPAPGKPCVAPVDYMKRSHMKLLDEWRTLSVRGGTRRYFSADGREFAISLSGTCLQQCHTDKAGFCDRCHETNGVAAPRCFDCHVDPGLIRNSAAQGARTGGSHDD